MPWRLRAWREVLRDLNHWRTHGSEVIALQKAREVMRDSDRDRRLSVLSMLESQAGMRRLRNIEWASTWAAINDVNCIELEARLGDCDECDRANLAGILDIVSGRRRDFPLDAVSEELAATKRESILTI